MQMVVGSILAVIGGGFLDRVFHTSPIILLILLLYVMIGSLYQLVKKASEHHE